MTDRLGDRLDRALERAIDEVELRRATARHASFAEAALGGLSEADAERAAFQTQYPFERFWSDLEGRAGRRAENAGGLRSVWRRAAAGLARAFANGRLATAAAAAGVVLVAGALWLAGPFGDDATDPSTTGIEIAPGVRAKGPPVPVNDRAKRASDPSQTEPVGIGFYVRRGGGAVPGVPGRAYREGDQFRFTYWSGANDYLLLFSMEEDGAVSVYYPDGAAVGDAGHSIAIAHGRNVALEGSVILNEYVGKERFFALFSARPISLGEVRAAAGDAVREMKAQGKDLLALERLPMAVPQASFWIEKVDSPTAGPGQ